MEASFHRLERSENWQRLREAIGFSTVQEKDLLFDMESSGEAWLEGAMSVTLYPAEEAEDVYAKLAQEFAPTVERPIPSEESCRELARAYADNGYFLLRVASLGDRSLAQIGPILEQECHVRHGSGCYCNLNRISAPWVGDVDFDGRSITTKQPIF